VLYDGGGRCPDPCAFVLVRTMHDVPAMRIHDAASGNGSKEHASGLRGRDWSEVARRAKHGLEGLPAQLADRARNKPLNALGVAAAGGVIVGIVLGSRILRAVVASTLSYAIVEIARGFVHESLGHREDDPVIHAS
jgi:hypothetical protein